MVHRKDEEGRWMEDGEARAVVGGARAGRDAAPGRAGGVSLLVLTMLALSMRPAHALLVRPGPALPKHAHTPRTCGVPACSATCEKKWCSGWASLSFIYNAHWGGLVVTVPPFSSRGSSGGVTV